MANVNCEACDELRQEVPSLIVNGFDESMCTSLKNDTGLNASSGHNDCTDLDNLNDCLVGNMEAEIDAYEVCDWKDYMRKLVPNLWTVGKAIICAICGIWTNIHRIWEEIENILCQIRFLYEGYSFQIGEAPTDGSYIVAGKGVSFLTRSDQDRHSTDIRLTFIGGGLARLAGSLEFFTHNWTEPGNTSVVNFDNGSAQRTSSSRLGNEYWNSNEHAGDTVTGNELIYEIRIKKSQYPQIRGMYGLFGQAANAAGFMCTVSIWDGDNVPAGQSNVWAYGQHGQCDEVTGAAEDHGSFVTSAGHAVPAGWIYVQLRMSYILDLVHGADKSRKPSPYAIVGMRFKRGEVPC